VISAPRILTPITGGSGQISGRFTVQQANNLSILLRAGALPAKMTIVEERTVGPGLGQDSIDAGKLAAMSRGLVVAYMLIDLRRVRHLRQYRAGDPYRLHLRRPDPARRDADLAGHRRHRSDASASRSTRTC
jgi:hypothetical protein